MRRPRGAVGSARTVGTAATAATVVTVVTVLAAGGCANRPSGGLAADASRPGVSRTVHDALRDLAREGAGDFTVHFVVDGTTYEEEGRYQLSPAAQAYTLTVTPSSGDAYSLEAVGVDHRFYVRAGDSGDSGSGCWLGGDPQRMSEATGAALSKVSHMLPGAAIVAATAKGTAYAGTGEAINGTLDLKQVLALASAQLPKVLGVTSGRVDATLTIEKGVLRGFSVTDRDFQTASSLPHSDTAQLDGAHVEVTFSTPSSPEPIAAPPSDQTVVLKGKHGGEPVGDPLLGDTACPAAG